MGNVSDNGFELLSLMKLTLVDERWLSSSTVDKYFVPLMITLLGAAIVAVFSVVLKGKQENFSIGYILCLVVVLVLVVIGTTIVVLIMTNRVVTADTDHPSVSLEQCWSEDQLVTRPSITPIVPPTIMLSVENTEPAILVTSQGNISIALNTTENLEAANAFACLALAGFYDGFVLSVRPQGGAVLVGQTEEPSATSSPFRIVDGDLTLPYEQGVVAFVSRGPNLHTGEFFIMTKTLPLPARYTIFGSADRDPDGIVDLVSSEAAEDTKSVDADPVVIKCVVFGSNHSATCEDAA